MAERLKLSKGRLSNILKVTAILDAVVAAFASPGNVQLKPAYALAQALDDKDAAKAIIVLTQYRCSTNLTSMYTICRSLADSLPATLDSAAAW